jgi:hypothetical protein
MTKPKFNDKPLLETVADAIATADMPNATYEDLAEAAIEAFRAHGRPSFMRFADRVEALNAKVQASIDQEDDGA